jgi:hypothetical protein
MPSVSINLAAIIVAALINMAIGAMWYSPLLFAKQWMKAVGKKAEEIGKPSPAYMFAFLGALLEAYVLAHFTSYALAMNAADGARVGLWLSLGIIVPVVATLTMFESKGIKWFLITIGYHALALMAMGAVIASWA